MNTEDTPPSLPNVIAEHLAQLQNLIDEHGWAVHAIEGAGEGGPPFAHTVGLSQTFDHPEVLVYGLPEQLAGKILNGVGQRINAGDPPPVGTRVPDVINHYDVVFIPMVDGPGTDDVIILDAMWEGRSERVVQLVWPDQHGRFPWDPECDPDIVRNQPVRGSAPML